MPQSESLFSRLVVDHLEFCCITSFLKETSRYSAAKIAEALGVSAPTVRYWRNKKLLKEIGKCSKCSSPQTHLELRKRAGGGFYFVRSYSRSSVDS